MLSEYQFILNPFKFVPRERLSNSSYPVTLSQFSSKDNWLSLINRVNDLRVDSDKENSEELFFKVPGGLDQASNKQVTFLVTCSEKLSGYPIKWTMVDGDRNVVADYTITKMGSLPIKKTGTTFYYPISSEIKRYFNSALCSTSDIAVSNVKINEPIDNNEFRIDPSQASVIEDDFHGGKTIEVPK